MVESEMIKVEEEKIETDLIDNFACKFRSFSLDKKTADLGHLQLFLTHRMRTLVWCTVFGKGQTNLAKNEPINAWNLVFLIIGEIEQQNFARQEDFL